MVPNVSAGASHPRPISQPTKHTNKGCVTPRVALPFILKKDFNAKEELWKLKYFTMQKYNLQKIL
jgi:hypothetical protein